MRKVFETAFFGGFKKRHVITYLNELNKEHACERQNLVETIARLEWQVSELTRQTVDGEQTATSLKAELENIASSAQESTGRAARLTARIAALEAEIHRLDIRLQEAYAENQSLSNCILNFADERRNFEAEKNLIRAEARERQRELESRIFDLEAEVLDSFDRKTEAWANNAENHRRMAAASEKDAQKGDGRLGSVSDILMHVKKK